MAEMAQYLIKRRLASTAARLKSLRAEIAVADEQIRHLRDDADDVATRALVSDNTGDGREAREAREHVEAMSSHRARMAAEIADLERRQDELLDQISAAR